MPSSSPPPAPASVPASASASLPRLSTSNTTRPGRPGRPSPRLSIPVGKHTTSTSASSPSAESSSASASASSPAIRFPPAHATTTTKPRTPGGHASPSNPSQDRATSGSASAATPTATTTARARRATVSDDTVASSSTSSYAEVIEMDKINPVGHRRRRSSLMSPASSSIPQTAGRNGHVRGPSVSGQFVMDEPKISEEGSEATIKGNDGFIRANPPADYSDEDLHDDEETGLTAKERKRKQRKKRRNTLLDQRIARDNITADEKKKADQDVVKRLTVNGCLIGLWYLFSLAISLYNKWMFDDNQLNFPYPLFTTSVHMLVQFTLACVVLYFVPSFRPHNSPQYRSELAQSREESGIEKPIMTKMFYLTRIGPCGAATGLDIGLGNTSLKFITLTFYTMCKSSSLAFVLMFAFLFRLETPTWRLVAIIATMTVGVVMMVAGEVEFDVLGFILIISAAFFSGFRWGLTQILLLRNPATSNPFSSIFFLAPVMFLVLISIAIPVEGFPGLIESLKSLFSEWGAATPFLLLFPGTIAFLMTACEFALLQRTSVVTLSIAGIFKEVVTISTATIVFDDKLTAINISGLFVTIGAICAYNWIKISKMRQDATADVHQRSHIDPDLSSPSSSSTDVEDDGGEETGLLAARASTDTAGDQGNLVTVDGDFVFPAPSQQPQLHTTGQTSGEDRDKSDRQD